MIGCNKLSEGLNTVSAKSLCSQLAGYRIAAREGEGVGEVSETYKAFSYKAEQLRGV